MSLEPIKAIAGNDPHNAVQLVCPSAFRASTLRDIAPSVLSSPNALPALGTCKNAEDSGASASCSAPNGGSRRAGEYFVRHLLMRIWQAPDRNERLSCDGSMGFKREMLKIALPTKANELNRDVRRQDRLR